MIEILFLISIFQPFISISLLKSSIANIIFNITINTLIYAILGYTYKFNEIIIKLVIINLLWLFIIIIVFLKNKRIIKINEPLFDKPTLIEIIKKYMKNNHR